jgi:hypothetical protein
MPRDAGADISRRHADSKPKKFSLPVAPRLPDSLWIDLSQVLGTSYPDGSSPKRAARLHPMTAR